MSKSDKVVILGVTGSIAAYKAVELARLIVKAGYAVRVVMTAAAGKFVGELTFRTVSRHPVLTDMFAEPSVWTPSHIAWADQAAAMVVAPCTANVIAKLAHGLADDALTAVALACPAPLLLAPAMNSAMWRHAATAENVELLKARGAVIVGPASGDLACGAEGQGRMVEPSEILTALQKIIA
ncbi:MAG: flavoprotein [Kiritimatiellia bacterium]|jgi:phosphopantothenoylcysteine synthetase/decarboxylase